MNIDEAFAEFLQTITSSTLGQDLYIGEAPSSNKAPDTIWWIVATGGNRITGAVSGENLKLYTVEIYYRSRNYKQVYDNIHSLEQTLNCDDCVQLEGYQTIDIQASVLGIDADLDNADRKIGLVQADITVYDNCIDVS